MRYPTFMRRLLIPALLLAGMLHAARAADVAPAPAANLPELQAQLTAVLKKHKLPGLGIALYNREGVIWAGGLGEADATSHKPVTADTLFRVGSITKSFVSVALLQLVEQGKLDLNARLRTLAPEIPVDNPWESTDPVTVATVLEHTAGFDDMHFQRFYDFDEPADIPLLTVLQRSTPELRVRWQPGSRMAYSNVDYLIAGYLLEKLSGERYEQYLAEHVLKPLEMDHASLVLDAGTLARLAQGYEGGDQHPVAPVTIYSRPAGALAASPAELAHFGVMLLNRGTWHNLPLLRAASVTRMETPKTGLAARHGLDYGYGLANFTSYAAGYEFHGHDGGIDGFTSRYAYAIDPGVGFVLLFNSSATGNAMREATQRVAAYLTRTLPQPLPPPAVRIETASLAALSGYYREWNPRNQVIAAVDFLLGICHLSADGKGGLRLTAPFQETVNLLPAGAGLWRRPDEPGPSSASYLVDGRQVFDLDAGARGAWLVKTNVVFAYGPLLLAAVSLLCMLSSLLFAPVWLLRLAAGKMRKVQHWSVRILPLAASGAFLLMLLGLAGPEPIALGRINVYTVDVFLSSLGFAGLSIAALLQALRAMQWKLNPWLRWHSLLVSTACFGMTLFLMYWGLIGLRMWSF